MFELWLLYLLWKRSQGPEDIAKEQMRRQVDACMWAAREFHRLAKEAAARGDEKAAREYLGRAKETLATCNRMIDQVEGNGLAFLSMLRPAKVSGAWFASWHAVWNGKQWLGPRKLSADQASEWHIDQLETYSHHTPFANIQLHKWTGSKWQRVA